MRVLLLAGGASNEREVSLTSGRAVFDALTRLGHDVLAVDPADGRSLLSADGRFIPPSDPPSAEKTGMNTTDLPALANALATTELRDIDVVFLALHGGTGENGVIQCLLELAGAAYTGSSMTASAVAMNKALAKRLFTYAGIPTPEWSLYQRVNDLDTDDLAATILGKFPLPVIVKPNDGGSTIGLTKVEHHDHLPAALKCALKESRDILVEQYIPGRELTVAVLEEDERPLSLPVIEIKPKSGLYDYEAKYTKGKSEYVCPAEVNRELAVRLQVDAIKAYNVIGCTGLARVDFMVANDGGHYCLEVNTIPGMTALSLAPMAARAIGIDFHELIARIIKSACRRGQR